MTDQPTIAKRPVIGITASRHNTESVFNMMTMVKRLGGTPIFLGDHPERLIGEKTVCELNSINDAPEIGLRQRLIDECVNLAKPNAESVVNSDLAKCDALFIMGNDESDKAPELYKDRYPNGHPRRGHKHLKTVSEMEHSAETAVRSVYEEEAVRQAVKAKMPVFGICAGSQTINVALGGGMIQHVPDHAGHDEHGQGAYSVPSNKPFHPVTLAKGSLLHQLAEKHNVGTIDAEGNRIVDENTRHHQAVDGELIAKGLKATGHVIEELPHSKGGKKRVAIVEGIEVDPNGIYKDRLIVGVQWHPEYEASKLSTALVQHMIEGAHIYAETNNRVHTKKDIKDDLTLPLAMYVPINSGTAKKPKREGSWANAARERGHVTPDRERSKPPNGLPDL